ncbi:MAG: potassium channel family protein [Bacilli bacterium]|jgi:K+ transport systems, NAD-binding component|nr:TrkA family potassium uptake protein [Staphylococcus sp.]
MANKKGKLIYGIIGLGRFGLSLAIELAEAGEDLIALDKDENKVSIIREYTENAYVVRNLEKQTLIDSGLKNCDVVVVCIAEQMDKSLLTTLNLVSMGIPKIIAKATSLEHGQILEKIGAEVVYPEHDMAVRLANRLETSSMLDFVQLSEKINISKVKIPNHIIGKTVLEIDLRAKFGLNIIAIENQGNVIELIEPNYIFKENDILYLSGAKNAFLKLSKWSL